MVIPNASILTAFGILASTNGFFDFDSVESLKKSNANDVAEASQPLLDNVFLIEHSKFSPDWKQTLSVTRESVIQVRSSFCDNAIINNLNPYTQARNSLELISFIHTKFENNDILDSASQYLSNKFQLLPDVDTFYSVNKDIQLIISKVFHIVRRIIFSIYTAERKEILEILYNDDLKNELNKLRSLESTLKANFAESNGFLHSLLVPLRDVNTEDIKNVLSGMNKKYNVDLDTSSNLFDDMNKKMSDFDPLEPSIKINKHGRNGVNIVDDPVLISSLVNLDKIDSVFDLPDPSLESNYILSIKPLPSDSLLPFAQLFHFPRLLEAAEDSLGSSFFESTLEALRNSVDDSRERVKKWLNHLKEEFRRRVVALAILLRDIESTLIFINQTTGESLNDLISDNTEISILARKAAHSRVNFLSGLEQWKRDMILDAAIHDEMRPSSYPISQDVNIQRDSSIRQFPNYHHLKLQTLQVPSAWNIVSRIRSDFRNFDFTLNTFLTNGLVMYLSFESEDREPVYMEHKDAVEGLYSNLELFTIKKVNFEKLKKEKNAFDADVQKFHFVQSDAKDSGQIDHGKGDKGILENLSGQSSFGEGFEVWLQGFFINLKHADKIFVSLLIQNELSFVLDYLQNKQEDFHVRINDEEENMFDSSLDHKYNINVDNESDDNLVMNDDNFEMDDHTSEIRTTRKELKTDANLIRRKETTIVFPRDMDILFDPKQTKQNHRKGRSINLISYKKRINAILNHIFPLFPLPFPELNIKNKNKKNSDSIMKDADADVFDQYESLNGCPLNVFKSILHLKVKPISINFPTSYSELMARKREALKVLGLDYSDKDLDDFGEQEQKVYDDQILDSFKSKLKLFEHGGPCSHVAHSFDVQLNTVCHSTIEEKTIKSYKTGKPLIVELEREIEFECMDMIRKDLSVGGNLFALDIPQFDESKEMFVFKENADSFEMDNEIDNNDINPVYLSEREFNFASDLHPFGHLISEQTYSIFLRNSARNQLKIEAPNVIQLAHCVNHLAKQEDIQKCVMIDVDDNLPLLPAIGTTSLAQLNNAIYTGLIALQGIQNDPVCSHTHYESPDEVPNLLNVINLSPSSTASEKSSKSLTHSFSTILDTAGSVTRIHHETTKHSKMYQGRIELVKAALSKIISIPVAHDSKKTNNKKYTSGIMPLKLLPDYLSSTDAILKAWPYLQTQKELCDQAADLYSIDSQNLMDDRNTFCKLTMESVQKLEGFHLNTLNQCSSIYNRKQTGKHERRQMTMLDAISQFPLDPLSIQKFCNQGERQRELAQTLLLNGGLTEGTILPSSYKSACGLNTEDLIPENKRFKCKDGKFTPIVENKNDADIIDSNPNIDDKNSLSNDNYDSQSVNGGASYFSDNYYSICGPINRDLKNLMFSPNDTRKSKQESVLQFTTAISDEAKKYSNIHSYLVIPLPAAVEQPNNEPPQGKYSTFKYLGSDWFQNTLPVHWTDAAGQIYSDQELNPLHLDDHDKLADFEKNFNLENIRVAFSRVYRKIADEDDISLLKEVKDAVQYAKKDDSWKCPDEIKSGSFMRETTEVVSKQCFHNSIYAAQTFKTVQPSLIKHRVKAEDVKKMLNKDTF